MADNASLVTKSDTPALVGREIGPEEKKERDRALKRWRELEAEYMSSWYDTQRDIIDHIQPGRGQFVVTETNRGARKDIQVLNNAATRANNKLAAALDVGVCSEAREWFVVQAERPEDMDDPEVREYCHDLQEAMFRGLAKVGWYAPNRAALGDTVGPATGAVLVEESDETVARCTHVPVGQYRVGASSSGEVVIFCRRYTFTASQMAEEFGAENCSIAVRAALRNQYTQTTKFTVLHLIERRADIEREHGKVDAKNMPWASLWLEIGQGYTGAVVPGQSDTSMPTGPQGILRTSGYREQPFYVYRWDSIGQDAYGRGSPGWIGLGNVKELQDVEMGSAQLLALLMRPPMNQPADLANASLLPGAMNPIGSNSRVKFEPSFTVDPKSVEEAEKKIAKLEARINDDNFGDILFFLTGNSQPEPKTAEEIRGIKEERLLQLGGVFARISDQLKVALRRFFGIFGRAGMLPPPPARFVRGGGNVLIEFTNPLVVAQKAIGFQAMQQVISLALSLAEAKKAGADQLDVDTIIDIAIDMLGVKPTVKFTDQQLAKMRAAIQAQQNAMQQQQAMTEAAPAIKDLSNSDPQKLQTLLQQFGPNAQAQAAPPSN